MYAEYKAALEQSRQNRRPNTQVKQESARDYLRMKLRQSNYREEMEMKKSMVISDQHLTLQSRM